jgi:alpha-methylacyl-CoA racemase
MVSIALNVPGPMAAARLRDLGATVVKLEPPDGDPLSGFQPAWYAQLHEGMSVETCDLKSESGRARCTALLEHADLLLTSQRPTALARLGLDWVSLQARFPRLCQVAIVGFPHPDQNIPGHDLTYLAANRLVAPPHLPLTLFADAASSEMAVSAALALLLSRAASGVGGYREVALADAARQLAQPLRHGLTERGALLGGGFPGYNLYRTIDGWIALAALEPHFYARLCELFDLREPSREALADRFAGESTRHWCSFAEQHGLPIALVPTDAAQ